MVPLARRIAVAAALVTCVLAAPAAVAYKRFCATADSLHFGNRALGSSTATNVTISSCGDEAWTFTGVSLHAATGAAFRVQSACATGMTLAPGESCDVNVTFAPLSPGQTSGALWLHQTSTTPDQLLTFYGRGIDATSAGTAVIGFSPPAADFGAVVLGTTSAWSTIALTNIGTAPLVPSALVINGRNPYDFATISYGDPRDCAVGRSVAPGASCALNFTFEPGETGSRSAQLVVDSPQLASLAVLPLLGHGVDASDGSIEAIEFFHAGRNHYFVTTEPAEAAMIDAGGVGPGWARTGKGFRVWPLASAAGANSAEVCRFFGAPGTGPEAHFFTGFAPECSKLKNDAAWLFEGLAFRAALPVLGQCAAGFDPVVRLYWNGSVGTDMRSSLCRPSGRRSRHGRRRLGRRGSGVLLAALRRRCCRSPDGVRNSLA